MARLEEVTNPVAPLIPGCNPGRFPKEHDGKAFGSIPFSSPDAVMFGREGSPCGFVLEAADISTFKHLNEWMFPTTLLENANLYPEAWHYLHYIFLYAAVPASLELAWTRFNASLPNDVDDFTPASEHKYRRLDDARFFFAIFMDQQVDFANTSLESMVDIAEWAALFCNDSQHDVTNMIGTRTWHTWVSPSIAQDVFQSPPNFNYSNEA